MENQPAAADDLGRSFAALVGGKTWEANEAEQTSDELKREGSGSRARFSNNAEARTVPPAPERILEALLFVGGTPLTPQRAGEIIRGFTEEQFTQAVYALNQAYRRQKRPYMIEGQKDGYVLALRPKFRSVPEKLHGGPREARLSTAAIDVLALVAYRQPASKAEVDSVRGAESGALLRQLVRRGLIQVAYRADANQREVSYGTTPRFLELFGLTSLDDLPRTQDLQGM